MDKFDRIYQLHQILAGRKTAIPVDALTERLECAKPTTFRLLRVLRDNLGAPVRFDADLGGYLYVSATGEGPYELPGLWFNERELVMDILRRGPEVVVMVPDTLRRAVAERLREALGHYPDG